MLAKLWITAAEIASTLNVAARSAAAFSITFTPRRCSLRNTASGGLFRSHTTPTPGERLQDVVGGVDLPPAETLAHAALIGVVIVVPALAHGEEGEQPVVAGVVARDVALAAVHVGQRVDAERAVIDRDRAPEKADDEPRPAGDSQERKASTTAGSELVAVQPAQLGVTAPGRRPWSRSVPSCWVEKIQPTWA